MLLLLLLLRRRRRVVGRTNGVAMHGLCFFAANNGGGDGDEDEEKKRPRARMPALEKRIPVMECPSVLLWWWLWQHAQKCAATSSRVMAVGAGAATRKRPR